MLTIAGGVILGGLGLLVLAAVAHLLLDILDRWAVTRKWQGSVNDYRSLEERERLREP